VTDTDEGTPYRRYPTFGCSRCVVQSVLLPYRLRQIAEMFDRGQDFFAIAAEVRKLIVEVENNFEQESSRG